MFNGQIFLILIYQRRTKESNLPNVTGEMMDRRGFGSMSKWLSQDPFIKMRKVNGFEGVGVSFPLLVPWWSS